MVVEGSTADIVLGRHWLTQHNPMVDWSTSEVLKWSKTCLVDCIHVVQKPDTVSPVGSRREENSCYLNRIYHH